MDNHPSQDQTEDVWPSPNWPQRLEKTFVELLLEKMKIHWDQIPSDFGDETWTCVSQEFNKETGKSYDKAELKKHLSVLYKWYRIVKPLYDEDGFGWDYRRKRVDIDDLVWAEILEVTPEVEPYRKWGCPLYEKLSTIFTRSLATGEYAMSPASYISDEGGISRSRTRTNVNGHNKRQFAETASSGPRKRNSKGLDNTKSGTTGAASASNKTTVSQTEDPNSLGNCINILNGIAVQKVDRRLYSAALDLFQNPVWRETFMTLNIEKCLTWLKAMLPKV